MTEEWTIKKLLDWTTGYFKKFNIEWPHLEAEILLSHALALPRIQLYVQFERVLKDDELAKYKALILRRSKREPIAYITGHQPFMSLDLEVNSSVLIPRPETEKLVEVAIEAAKGIEKPLIADIGVGSGAIAVSLAKHLPQAELIGTDSSVEALEVVKKNADKTGVSDRCKFLSGDLFAPLDGYKGKFDIVVSNPPYIKTGEIDKLQPEIKFEPRGALDGGEDGLKFYRIISAQAAEYIKSGGFLILEVGMGQAQDVVKLIEGTKRFQSSKIIKDLSGIDRVVTSKRT